jgi:Ca-activated chloride channel family protein
MRILQPYWFLLLIPLSIYFVYRRRHLFHTTILFPNVQILRHIAHRRTALLSRASLLIRVVTILCIIIALARPQGILVEQEVSAQGIDIMLALDVSGSMAAEDFKPKNRLEVAKITIKSFINNRLSDRIGLVIFGKDAYTQCPQTLDYDILSSLLDSVTLNAAGQGTAIGMAIVTALNRLKDSVSQSKIIILLTDGENNRGEISPTRAAILAKEFGVKIYTIGIGTEKVTPFSYHHHLYGKVVGKTRLDETVLTQIAKLTHGRYFHAVDTAMLQNVLSQIDQLETSEIKSINYNVYDEWFPFFVTAALIMIILELLLTNLMAVKAP